MDGVERLAGIGPKLAAVLSEAGVTRVVDLLLNLPLRYEDRTRAVSVASAIRSPGQWVLVRGRVWAGRSQRTRRRRLSVVQGRIEDSSGAMPVVWFNRAWVARRAGDLGEVWAFGLVRSGPGGAHQLVNPEVEEVEPVGAGGRSAERLVPVYPRLGSLSGRRLRRLVEQSLEALDRLDDPVPAAVLEGTALPGLGDALRAVHLPPTPADPGEVERLVAALALRSAPAHRRLAFDELLAFACGVTDLEQRRARASAPACLLREPVDDLVRRTLPFPLTGAQRRALGEIVGDMGRSRPMARLLQGDVGSGKTAVAALAMEVAASNGCQAAMMAPTDLLAAQHARTLAALLGETGRAPRLLTASRPAAERREVLAGLASGETGLVVGTHALLQESVRFRRLALAVVDEQHRFGVGQRQALLEKGEAPHLLVMTATPIPRSLALTLYGDLRLTVIDELPPGRRPVTTVLRTASARPRLYEFLRREVAEGGRAYIVCPQIEPSEQAAVRALADHVRQVRSALPGVAVGVLHGRLPAHEREQVASDFAAGRLQVLVATTVVEVGIDVPEATVMVVESPERFGLSQLHQLRGRVGRGARRSWCAVVVSDEGGGEEGRRRLEAFCATTDGFAIAEADLALRGPGELAGSRQWGRTDFRFADLQHHRDLVELARGTAARLAASGELSAVREGLATLHRTEVEVEAG